MILHQRTDDDMNNVKRECPQCGRRITKISSDGRIGFCDYHKEWFAFFSDASGEASEANRKYKEEEQRRKLEEERIRIQRERDRERKAKRAIALKLFVCVFVVALIAIAILWFKIIPEKEYKEAETLFTNGQYKEAHDKYVRLKGFSDSKQKAAICEAFIQIEKGNTSGAIEVLSNSESGLENEAFRLIYDAMFERCQKNPDAGEGYKIWVDFGNAYSSELARYGLKQDYDSKKNDLQTVYADQLAKEMDEACAEHYKELLNSGVDVSANVKNAIDQAAPGLYRIHLREVLISWLQEKGEDSEEQKALLKEDIHTCLDKRKDLGLSVDDTYELLRKASHNELSGFDYQSISKELGMQKAGEETDVSDHVYLDIDKDGQDELIIVSSAGTISAYKYYPDFIKLSTIETELISPSVQVINGYLLALSKDNIGFSIVSYEQKTFMIIRSDKNMVDFQQDGNLITYGKELPGSISRSVRYQLTIDNPLPDTVVADIEWGKEDYPCPNTPEETVQRYFEARGYEISDEAEVLLAPEELSEEGFSFEDLSKLTLPEDFCGVKAVAYDRENDYVLLEVQYTVQNKDVIKYFATIEDSETGRWGVAGSSDTFAAGIGNVQMKSEIPVLNINSEMTGHLLEKGDKNAFRILLPHSSKVQIVWQSGEEQKNSVAYQLELFDGNDSTDRIISYDLKLSDSKQKTTPLFLPGGVYYIQISAVKSVDADYSLSFQASAGDNYEREKNDSPEKANVLKTNQMYTGSLFEKTDEDWYRFRIEQPGSIKVTIGAEATGNKTSKFIATVCDIEGKRILTQCELTDNVEKAESGNVYLRSGDYCIHVSKGSLWTSYEYQVEVDYNESDYSEEEFNDQMEEATSIPLNQDIVASFGTEGDVDYFSFSVDRDVIAQPRISFDPLETSTKVYVLSLYKDNTLLYEGKIGGKESDKVLVPYPLGVGKYYIKMENPSFNPNDYILHATAVQVDQAENEPNNELAGAMPLEPGVVVSGVLSTEEDLDYYSVELQEDTTVTLQFEFTPVSGSNTVYTIQLEQNGKRLWSENISGASGGMTQKLQIPAGRYYLKIKPSSWTSSVYKLSIG